MAEYDGYSTHHENQYSADKACKHCEGIVRHENWCITRNALVWYANAVIEEPVIMSDFDLGILKAYRIRWNACASR